MRPPLPSSAPTPASRPSLGSWSGDLVAFAACGAAAVLAMAVAAWAALAALGLPSSGADGVATVAVVVAAAVGGAVDLQGLLDVGPLSLTVPGTVRFVPVAVTAVGVLTLAAAWRAVARRGPRTPSRMLAGALTAAAGTAVTAACVAAVGHRHLALPASWPTGLSARTPGTGEVLGGGLLGGGRGPALGGGLDVVADVGAAARGGVVVALVTLVLAVAVAPRTTPRRTRGRGRGRAAGRLALPVGLGTAALLAAVLQGAPWTVLHRATLLVLALPDLMLQVLCRAAGVPWTLDMAGPGGAFLPTAGATAGATAGLDQVGGLLRGPEGASRAVVVLAVVAVAALAGLRSGLASRDRAGAPGAPRDPRAPERGRAVAVAALVGAAVLGAATWLAQVRVAVAMPFGGRDLAHLVAEGPVVAGIALGAGWGAGLALVVLGTARLARRSPPGRPQPGRRTPDRRRTLDDQGDRTLSDPRGPAGERTGAG